MQVATDGHSYATYQNAVTALQKALAPRTADEPGVRWLIATTAAGRFVPVVFGADFIPLAFGGKISVVA